MMKRTTQIVLIASLAATLAACGSKADNTGGQQPPPVVVTPRQEDQFGANFGTLFRGVPNSEPGNIADGDVVAISNRAEPVALN